MNEPDVRPAGPVLPTLALFGSLTTLVCCALPAMLVSLGFGAAMAGLYAAVPQAAWLGQNKALVFGVAGALIATSAVWLWRARSSPCPADPAQARACSRMRALSAWLLGLSAGGYLVGGFFAFFAADLLL